MRWKYPQINDIRVRPHFCLLPLQWEGTTYWLETVVLIKRFTFMGIDGGWSWVITNLTPIHRRIK